MTKVTYVEVFEPVKLNGTGVPGIPMGGVTNIRANDVISITADGRGYLVRIEGSAVATRIGPSNVRFAWEETVPDAPASERKQQGKPTQQ